MTVLLDMDPGVDDALAILLAAASPELKIAGVTTVSGNVSLELTTANALHVLEMVRRNDVPVYKGADRPLRGEPVRAVEVHGAGGLGDVNVEAEVGGRWAEDGGVAFLVETLAAQQGEVTVVATGPLTNLALAEEASPGILTRARDVVVMGGTVLEPGNVTAAAEFNFYADPDAARAVLEARDGVKLVGLDVTHQVVLTRDAVNGWFGGDVAVSRFVTAATGPVIDYCEQTIGLAGVHLHDPLALAVVLDPSLVAFDPAWVTVETEGVATRGALVTDRRPYSDRARLTGRPSETASAVDAERFLEMFHSRLASLAKAIG